MNTIKVAGTGIKVRVGIKVGIVRIIIIVLLSLVSLPCLARDWYVDPINGGDRQNTGGSSSTIYCNALTDDPASMHASTDHNCPWRDPRFLWTDRSGGGAGNNAWVMSAGDIVWFYSQADQRIAGSDVATNPGDFCVGLSLGCSPPIIIPSGTSSAHIIFRGENYQNCNTPDSDGNQIPDPTKTAKLWAGSAVNGNQVSYALGLWNTHYVEFQCVDISSHSPCNGTTISCVNNNASVGINTGPNADMANIWFTDVHVHRFSGAPILGTTGGSGKNIHVTRMLVEYGGSSGWNFDYGSMQVSTGGIDASYLGVNWNGCTEEYPDVDPIPTQTNSCTDQSHAGYGDGVGTPPMGGWDWTCDHCFGHYNTQDLYDLGHLGGSNVVFSNGGPMYGNMGGNIKIGPNATVNEYNNQVIGNCHRMAAPIMGVATGYNNNLGDFCRAFAMGGLNQLSNSKWADSAFTSSGTVITGTTGVLNLTVHNGDHVAPASQNAITWERTVMSVNSPTSITLSSAFPSNVTSPDALIVVDPGGPASTSVDNVYHNTFVGYANIMDNSCQTGGLLSAQVTVDSSNCPGYIFNYTDNISAGYSNPNYNMGMTPPQYGNSGSNPTTENNNIYYNLSSCTTCSGSGDSTMSPLFTGQPATPMTTDADLDGFNFNISTSSPAKYTGVVIVGQVTDKNGFLWNTIVSPFTPSTGSVEFNSVMPPVAGATGLQGGKWFGGARKSN